MVRVYNQRGDCVKINLLDVLVPGTGRPQITRIASADTSRKSSQESAKAEGKDKGEGSQTNTEPASKGKAKNKKSAAAKKEKETISTDEWTAEQDKKLLELKGQGVSWRNISQALKKNKKAVTQRFGELTKNNRASDKEGEKKNAYEQLQVEMPGVFAPETKSATNTPTTAPSLAKVVEAAKQQPKFEMSSARHTGVVVPDEIYRAVDPGPIYDFKDSDKEVGLTMQEILFIGRMNDYFDEQKWLLISSRLFDKTQKRVSHHALRCLFEGEAGNK